MPALVAGIHVSSRDRDSSRFKDMDGRNKSGHDEPFSSAIAMLT